MKNNEIKAPPILKNLGYKIINLTILLVKIIDIGTDLICLISYYEKNQQILLIM